MLKQAATTNQSWELYFDIWHDSEMTLISGNFLALLPLVIELGPTRVMTKPIFANYFFSKLCFRMLPNAQTCCKRGGKPGNCMGPQAEEYLKTALNKAKMQCSYRTQGGTVVPCIAPCSVCKTGNTGGLSHPWLLENTGGKDRSRLAKWAYIQRIDKNATRWIQLHWLVHCGKSLMCAVRIVC